VIWHVYKEVTSDGDDVRLLRQQVGQRLLASGTEMAFDRQKIVHEIATRSPGRYDEALVAQTLFLVQLISRLKVRLGLLILP
jgi:hypothetical protein